MLAAIESEGIHNMPANPSTEAKGAIFGVEVRSGPVDVASDDSSV
jgi:hypothetical protein